MDNSPPLHNASKRWPRYATSTGVSSKGSPAPGAKTSASPIRNTCKTGNFQGFTRASVRDVREWRIATTVESFRKFGLACAKASSATWKRVCCSKDGMGRQPSFKSTSLKPPSTNDLSMSFKPLISKVAVPLFSTEHSANLDNTFGGLSSCNTAIGRRFDNFLLAGGESTLQKPSLLRSSSSGSSGHNGSSEGSCRLHDCRTENGPSF
mmetsp:Transcript_37097/g.73446  ORF Transcript_37097/g.73446 Transcript_37097/m.73446 type:complete len:208 (+) Transcript_37097:1231-1854(+)